MRLRTGLKAHYLSLLKRSPYTVESDSAKTGRPDIYATMLTAIIHVQRNHTMVSIYRTPIVRQVLHIFDERVDNPISKRLGRMPSLLVLQPKSCKLQPLVGYSNATNLCRSLL